jgi:hypothetical protein
LIPDSHNKFFIGPKLVEELCKKREALEESRAVHIRNPNYCYMRRIFGVDEDLWLRFLIAVQRNEQNG